MTSVRADIITKRTYCRPLSDGSFETWEDVVERSMNHQYWLWHRAMMKQHGQVMPTDTVRMWAELNEFRQLMLDRKISLSGRTLWLGGTDISKSREASQFNCAHLKVETIHDVVDSLWLLLQGCGVGFTPVVGTLSGFTQAITDVEIIRSKRTDKGGRETNKETYHANTRHWKLSVGDSAESWAKCIGKILAFKGKATKLILDFSQLRPAGKRLAGYGWISSGDEALAKALSAIVCILNKKAGQLLSKIDILDIMNWLGTVLSSRRSAEIALVYYDTPEWEEFARAKEDLNTNGHRAQSNNSLVFWRQPKVEELQNIFKIIQESGGSEPGLINGEEARKRAPWWSGVNPCAEILLGNKSFCNLSEVDLSKFQNDSGGLERALYLTARANYRQTLVNLDDGILQRTWHENNEYLRLCGVGLTGVTTRGDINSYDFKRFKNIAVHGAYSMADELGTQRPKNVTTIKPSGTLSKIMDTTEGCHKPAGKFIFNNVNFSVHDPVIPILQEAGYKVVVNPTDESNYLVTFPVSWEHLRFTKEGDKYVNDETAVEQLERYKMLMDTYVEQNCSITVNYRPSDVPHIIDWLLNNWDSYVGVSFLPVVEDKDEKTYAYLPQEVVTEEAFREYERSLKPVSLNVITGFDEVETDECSTGACPVK